jgi:hypothetical protein
MDKNMRKQFAVVLNSVRAMDRANSILCKQGGNAKTKGGRLSESGDPKNTPKAC